MNHRKQFRIAAAAVSATALLTLGLGAPMAMADPGDPYSVGGTNQEADNPALINGDATVQLSVHKYLGAPTGQPNNGTEQTVTGVDPLQGVNFDVYRVEGVDLTTNEGWQAATALQDYEITDADITNGYVTVGGTQYNLTLADTVTTGADGSGTFTQANGVGLYLVNENVDSSGTITNTTTNEEVPKNSITPSAPFLVTLPMTEPTGAERWMYDVNVYPKNQSDSIEKAVADQGSVTEEQANGQASDHEIVYTITSSITDSADPLGRYVVNDQLDPRVQHVGTIVELSNGTALAEGTDYTLTAPTGPGGLVTVEFTEAGRTKLEANRDADVVTKVTVRVLEEGTDGAIPNTATFIPNDSFTDPIPSNGVESKYGDLVIDKFNPVGGAKLAGATFSVYVDADNDEQCTAADVTDANKIGDLGPTEGNGAATFKGLQASDFYNGAAQTDLITYCLVETKAPEGYNLDATPRAFTVLSDGVAELPSTIVEVPNEESNLSNSLPLTGGQGVAAMSILGVLLVGGGVTYYVVSNRRRQQA